jgi:antitoxin component of MazEF toxin-antitoxin module
MKQTISHTKIVRIGNSKGIVIPKKMLNFLGDTVRLKMKNESILVEPVRRKVLPQTQWEKVFAKYKNDYDENEFADFDTTLNDGLDDE